MVNLFLPLLLGLSSTTLAASLPKDSLNPSMSMNLTDLYTSSTNTTSLGDDIPGGVDPRFGVKYTLGGIRLRPVACLINAANAMANLALQDFSGTVPPVVARLPEYPDVVIISDATAASPGTTPTRYILWGIWSLALFMMKNDNYQTMLLTLGFNGVAVAYLRIEQADPQVLSLTGVNNDSSVESLKRRSGEILPATPSTNGLANFTQFSNSSSLSLTTNTTAPLNAGDLRIVVTALGRPITMNELFIPIFAGLEYVARHPSTFPIEPFIVRPADTDMEIEFQDYGTQPRTAAPFFEYQWVAKALGKLPEHLVMLGRWCEANFVVQVDGVRVGEGWIRKGRGLGLES